MAYPLKRILDPIIQPVYWSVYKWYFSKPRWYNQNDLQIRILPTVFHPSFFLSTQVFLQFILSKDLCGKKILDLGAGSGLISLSIAKEGGQVFATDINSNALKAMEESKQKNNLDISILYSDLFDNIPKIHFDYILINPPYFPLNPQDMWEQAFFCGENFEYFHKLFSQIKQYINPETKVYCILNEDCKLNIIQEIARKNRINFIQSYSKRVRYEIQYIFELVVV